MLWRIFRVLFLCTSATSKICLCRQCCYLKNLTWMKGWCWWTLFEKPWFKPCLLQLLICNNSLGYICYLICHHCWFHGINVSGPFWSLVPALSMVYSYNFFPVAEFPPLFSSRSSKLDLLGLAADENQMWVLTAAVWSAWAPSFKCPGSRRSVCYRWSFQVKRRTCNQSSALLLNRAGKLKHTSVLQGVTALRPLPRFFSVLFPLCVELPTSAAWCLPEVHRLNCPRCTCQAFSMA